MKTGANGDLERLFVFLNAALSFLGFILNILSLPYFIRRRSELGNAFLAYLNMSVALVCLSAIGFLIALSFNAEPSKLFHEFRIVMFVVSSQTVRFSSLINGVITIFLNVLRTSVIVWPMMRLNKRHLHISLIVFFVVLFVTETLMGVLYTYPHSERFIEMLNNVDTQSSLSSDFVNPFLSFAYIEFLTLEACVVLAVLVCCIVSTTKLLHREENLNQNLVENSKREAATTVLILSVQYVLLNTSGFIFTTLKFLQDLQVPKGRSDPVLGHSVMFLVLLNCVLNPVIYLWRVKDLRIYIKTMLRRE